MLACKRAGASHAHTIRALMAAQNRFFQRQIVDSSVAAGVTACPRHMCPYSTSVVSACLEHKLAQYVRDKMLCCCDCIDVHNKQQRWQSAKLYSSKIVNAAIPHRSCCACFGTCCVGDSWDCFNHTYC